MTLQRRSRVTPAERARDRGPFAAVVTARRHELDLTQAELAALAGVARGPVLAVEAGRAVTLEVLLAILEVLGLHLELARGAGVPGLGVSDELSAHYGLRVTEADVDG